MSFPAALTLSGIRLYQRHISPRKGFSCAHAALHGGESCSAAVARIVREDGLRKGRARIAARFGACRRAHNVLHAGSPLAFGTAGPRVRGVCCCGPIPIPIRCG
ncbi:membrane protein insertion efficiency factor YidD [Deinococcus budaensis]|uniref:Putative component of membrane protein insertase Oxa1/YidC/SpoIIIJ protein YidD n=1 Tax=Deinococcus budaensis TaxID=1665626 RepID=A0A7W8LPC9_9DEIO|nr:membrane protein insertion efficiency factor YidD [Deinococcus budaensis]MBB5233497.1 putative component of membrane protein insertase Oxa1/YidC/SpoIIIJ protein YidD [Deinococcus budaensis]